MKTLLWGGALAVLLVLLMLSPSGAALGTETPYPTFTPSATLRPLQPTPTSKYSGLRGTPTPWVINPATLPAEFVLAESAGTFSDTIINGYRVLNFGGILDMLSLLVMVVVLVGYLVRIQRRMTNQIDD